MIFRGRDVRLALAAGLALILAAPTGASARAGDLDPSFGQFGVATARYRLGAAAFDLAAGPKNTTVATGIAISGKGFIDVAVTRFTSKGKLDRSFSKDGRVAIDMDGGADLGVAVSVASNGAPVVAAATITDIFDCCEFSTSVIKLTPSGGRNKSFGDNGVVELDPIPLQQSQTFPVAIAAMSGGGVLVGLNTFTSMELPQAGAIGAAQGMLIKLDATGTLDPTFGVGGVVLFGLDPVASFLTGMMVQGDGSVVAIGSVPSSTDGFVVARYNAFGVLDPTFAGGVVTLDLGRPAVASAVGEGVGGTIYVAGNQPGRPHWIVTRFAADGTLDGRFSSDGIARVSAGATSPPTGVGYRSKRVYLAGTIVSCTFSCVPEAGLVRLTAKGAIDKKFGIRGIAGTFLRISEASGLIFHGKKPVTAGTAGGIFGIGGIDMAVARFKP